MNLHPLLTRQLQHLGLDASGPLPSAKPWTRLLELVSRAYKAADDERCLMQRSQLLASQEMSELNAALRLSQERLESLVSLSADWIWEQDENLKVTFVSASVKTVTGIDPSEFIGRARESFASYDTSPEALAEYHRCIEARLPFRNFTYGMLREGGRVVYFRVSGEPTFDPQGRFTGYRGVASDVTASMLAAREMRQLARYDSLTGLPNRTMFVDELQRTIARAQRENRSFALCFIDLDRFKNINDSLGHASGDELLKVMAGRLRGLLREGDLVARLGGDEFVVLIEGNPDSTALTMVAQRMLTAIGEPFDLQGHGFQVSGSIGIAQFPDDGDDATTLLRHADTAMYQAKAQGKNNVQFYTAEWAEQAARLFAIENDLRHAIERGELQLHYQPKVSISSGEIVGAEALLRWRHPQRGLVPPTEFIPVAEDRGLIIGIGRWVVQAACAQLRSWRDAGLRTPCVAVNLSVRQLASDSLVEDFGEALTVHGLSPLDLEIEITESALMADPDRANRILHCFHDMGMRISIDDFGTGYSSLAYLKRFPASTVKIDRSFVSGLPGDRDDLAITQAVIAMAHTLGLSVVAEGVETRPQLGMLRELGCDEAQGYLFGRPVPAEQFAQLLPRRPQDAKVL